MTGKKKRAAGVRYRHGVDEKPFVVSRGEGVVAEEILRVARENKIPIKEDGGLVDALLKLDYMQEIPEELFYLVAEVLVFSYQTLDRELNTFTKEPDRKDP
jgi:flagellar biosynthesis protein